jgi:hypothetical protein
MTVHDIILVWVAVALGFSLSARFGWRTMRRRTERHWTGHGISASVIKGQIDRVRRDHLSATHRQADRSGRCRVRLAIARRGLERLPYFKRQAAQQGNCRAEPLHRHQTEDHADL